MKNLINERPTLLLVDVQKAFLDPNYPGLNRNNPNAEVVCGKILNSWRELKLPVIHVRHSSIYPDSLLHESKIGFEFNDNVKPLDSELVLTKSVNSAFIGTDLSIILKESKTTTIVVVGMTTNHCISTTVRMSGNLGYNTYLISDSTACYDTKSLNGDIISCDVIYDSSIASLNNEFATVIDSSELFSMLN